MSQASETAQRHLAVVLPGPSVINLWSTSGGPSGGSLFAILGAGKLGIPCKSALMVRALSIKPSEPDVAHSCVTADDG